MDSAARLASNLKRLRLAQDLSQEELAHRSGLHRTYLSGLERAGRNPTLHVLDTLACSLGVSIGALVE